jgi:pimeloyl-ACP methyl ester carboxylesterase
VEFNQDKAVETFFNASKDIGRLLVGKMIPQFRLDAPPMPKQLHAPLLYLFPIEDMVRDLGSVLEAVEYYRKGPNKMYIRIVEGDHAVPITQPEIIGNVIMSFCVRTGLTAPAAPKAPAILPAQRRAFHDSQQVTPIS